MLLDDSLDSKTAGVFILEVGGTWHNNATMKNFTLTKILGPIGGHLHLTGQKFMKSPFKDFTMFLPNSIGEIFDLSLSLNIIDLISLTK